MTLFDHARQFVDESFAGNEAQLRHFDRTVDWLKILKPDADEAFLLAALLHDIERAYPNEASEAARKQGDFKDPEFLRLHQEEGARIAGEFLTGIGAPQTTVDRVKHLISKHEVGGDEDQNLLMDADSLSFVENNGPLFFAKLEQLGYKKIESKLTWMYERMYNQAAIELATPLFNTLITDLKIAAQKLQTN